MLVDWEAVVLDLKRHILSKRSHGQDELLRTLAQIENDRRVPEGQEGFSDLPSLRSANGSELTQAPHPLPAGSE